MTHARIYPRYPQNTRRSFAVQNVFIEANLDCPRSPSMVHEIFARALAVRARAYSAQRGSSPTSQRSYALVKTQYPAEGRRK